MSDSDSSSLSSAPDSDVEKLAPIFLKSKSKAKPAKGTKKKPVRAATPPSPPRPKRSPSPPHEEVLADNGDIAFIVMFRSRFSEVLPAKLAHFGPQDIERGVVDSVPSQLVENVLCALLGLVNNRQKPVERGHHGRALEEAISKNKHQWPKSWNATNPLPGSKTFNDLGPAQRLNLLRTLIVWSLQASDAISSTIKDSYKQTRHEDDLNQSLSVQPWGVDGDKRRYWLIEGRDDTCFRLYREGNRANKNIQWISIAGSIDEVKAVADKLESKDTTQAARRLADRIRGAIPRFEATEEKRRRREYRQSQKQRWVRPEPGFSLYEGRTRGKRLRYTFDDDNYGEESDALSTRRSTRNSDRSTPLDAGLPVVTASGRQVRPRGGGMYGESLLSGQATNADTPVSGSYAASETSDQVANGTRRSGRSTRLNGSSPPAADLNGSRKRKHIDTYNSLDDISDEDDAASSTNEWDGGEDYDENENADVDSDDDGDDDMSVDEEENPKSFMVTLKVGDKLKQSNGMKSDDTATKTTDVKPQQKYEEVDSQEMPPHTTTQDAEAGAASTTQATSQSSAQAVPAQDNIPIAQPTKTDLASVQHEPTNSIPTAAEPLAPQAPSPQPATHAGLTNGATTNGGTHSPKAYPAPYQTQPLTQHAQHVPQIKAQTNGWT